MKPLFQKLPLPSDSSFVLVDFDVPYFGISWHFHPEYKIVLVSDNTGRRFVGEHIKEYTEGNLCFIESNVPHLHRSLVPLRLIKSVFENRLQIEIRI